MENLFTQNPSTIIKELVLIVYRTFNHIIFFILKFVIKQPIITELHFNFFKFKSKIESNEFSSQTFWQTIKTNKLDNKAKEIFASARAKAFDWPLVKFYFPPILIYYIIIIINCLRPMSIQTMGKCAGTLFRL